MDQNYIETSEEQQQKFEKLKSYHDDAYLYINKAITQEKPDINRPGVALMMYQKGLSLLELALSVETESGEGPLMEEAKKMQQIMSKSKFHVQSKIDAITNRLAPLLDQHGDEKQSMKPEAPGSQKTSGIEQFTETEIRKAAPPPYTEIDLNPNTIRRSGTSDSVHSIFSMDGVQVFHASASGEVSTPSYPETLHIIKFTRDKNMSEALLAQLPPAFIEVGEWTYPLLKGKKSIIKADFGGYMFTDVDGDITGGAVGIIIPDEIKEKDRKLFESLLTEITTAFKTQEEVEVEYPKYKEISNALARGLVKGTEVVGRGMVSGAEKTSEYLSYGSDYFKQYITPEETAKEVDPKLKQRLETASSASVGVFGMAGWMMSQVGSATVALGKLAAPHIEKGATQALASLTSQSSDEASNQLAKAGEIASGTAAAVSNMYKGLENSSKILAKNMADNTVKIVSHKYGTDVAELTGAAFATVGNSYSAFQNAGEQGHKGAVNDPAKAAIGITQSEVDLDEVGDSI